jgi:hypothetical protein
VVCGVNVLTSGAILCLLFAFCLCGSLQKGLGDFERFQMMVARKTRAKAVNKAVKAMTLGKK